MYLKREHTNSVDPDETPCFAAKRGVSAGSALFAKIKHTFGNGR